MKKLLGAFAAIMLAMVVLAPPADARCWWNGYRWRCTHHYYHHARYWHPYRYYGYGYYPYYYGYYRPYYAYACVWPFCW